MTKYNRIANLTDALADVKIAFLDACDAAYKVAQSLKPEELVELSEEEMHSLAELEAEYESSLLFGEAKPSLTENEKEYNESRSFYEYDWTGSHDLKRDIKLLRAYLAGTNHYAADEVENQNMVAWIDTLNEESREIFMNADMTKLRMHISSAKLMPRMPLFDYCTDYEAVLERRAAQDAERIVKFSDEPSTMPGMRLN